MVNSMCRVHKYTVFIISQLHRVFVNMYVHKPVLDRYAHMFTDNLLLKFCHVLLSQIDKPLPTRLQETLSMKHLKYNSIQVENWNMSRKNFMQCTSPTHQIISFYTTTATVNSKNYNTLNYPDSQKGEEVKIIKNYLSFDSDTCT